MQNIIFSGYFKEHGLRAQVIVLPNGVFGNVHVTSIRHQENTIIGLSNLNEHLMTVFANFRLIVGLLPAACADAMFGSYNCIVPRKRNPSRNEDIVNKKMARLRMSIEHVFGDFFNLWKLFDNGNFALKLLVGRNRIKKLMHVTFFISNLHCCLNKSRSNMFNVPSLNIDEYSN